ncbi:hypothetical protein VTJ04DRAFT_6612 [Mycothermus thermophilus]|uniref:uncharacterized protein n=1 Tax=Humicola insolens TaxID=85995 RepID=UPI003742E0AD
MSVRAAAAAAAAVAAVAASAVIGERSRFLSTFVGAINVDERGTAACLLACLPVRGHALEGNGRINKTKSVTNPRFSLAG